MGAVIDDALLELLRPLIQAEVQRAMTRERDRWRWASVRQAAERLDMSEAAIHKRVQRRQLPFRKLDGRVYIDMRAVDRQLNDAVR